MGECYRIIAGMNNDDLPPVEMDTEMMMLAVDEAVSILGNDWFARRLSKEKADRAIAQGRDPMRQRVLHRPRHIIVEWYLTFLAWLEAFVRHDDQACPQGSMFLASFSGDLAKVKDCSGLHHILPRLRDPEEFLAAAFEVEVASYYVGSGWTVEFIETTVERSPDIKVTRDDGTVFWVECKRRDELSGRDVLISKFWDQLLNVLYRAWRPIKSNVAVTLIASGDPALEELDNLRNALVTAAKYLTEHVERNQMEVRGFTSDCKYRFTIDYLADPDQEIPLPFHMGPADLFFLQGHVRRSEEGTAYLINPVLCSFTNEIPTDKYVGVFNAFKSAVGQLPEGGPGVIWIRLPYPQNEGHARADLQNMTAKLENALSGVHNTRVNCVVLSSRVISQEPISGASALTFRHISASMMHKNPRYLV